MMRGKSARFMLSERRISTTCCNEEIAEEACKQPSMKPILLGGSALIKIRGTDAGITSS